MAFIMNTDSLTVSAETFARLQSYAVPLVDTIDTIVGRLCDHWDANPPVKEGFRRHILDTPQLLPEPVSYKTSRGVELPIPLPLYADYGGKRIQIRLTKRGFEWNDLTFTDPSSVAVAVKKAMGASDAKASTNGWTFWLIGDGSTLSPQNLDYLRQAWLEEQSRKRSTQIRAIVRKLA